MTLYIAYKYSNHQDKQQLIRKLDQLSEFISSSGSSTFILGRDIKKWQHLHINVFALCKLIIENMRKCNAVCAFVDSSCFSKGLYLEIIISKILNKRSFLILEDVQERAIFMKLFSKIYRIKSLEELTPEMFSASK